MTVKQQLLFDKNLQINEEILSTNIEENSNYPFIEPWKSLNEFCNIFSVDYAARHYFDSLINIGDEIIPDMSRFKNSGYWGKKYDMMKGIVAAKGIGQCLTIDFENGDKGMFLLSENIVEINGRKDNYQNYIKKINELRDLEKGK